MSNSRLLNPESQFLAGPNSRGKEFMFVLRTAYQFIRGFRKLHFIGPAITVFGSARFKEDNPYYIQARALGASLSKLGFSVMTGGGPGIMEAANRGAFEVGGESIGCTIKLPREQTNNPYMTKFVPFEFFFVRKVLLTKYSYAFVVMPGGFGTLDELFETLTLIQTGIVHKFPVVIMGTDFYKDVVQQIEKMILGGTISPDDKHLIKFTDDVDEACSHITQFISMNYMVKPKAFWLLGERK